MEVEIVKVTDKGQISIPVSFRKSANIHKGDKLVMVRNDSTILLEKVKQSNFGYLLKHSEKVAERLWGNEQDEIWNEF